MLQLSKYAYGNARIRAMKSRLLTPEQVAQLTDASDVHQLFDILKTTPYSQAVSTALSHPGDKKIFERELARQDLATGKKILTFFKGAERKTVLLLLQRYELDFLKLALRLWKKRRQLEAGDFLSDETISHRIDFAQIVSASSLEEIIALLKDTPYVEPLAEKKNQYSEKQSLFLLEAALDRDYFSRLVTHAKSLGRTDRAVLEKIIGLEIDIENIRWLLRAKKYYSGKELSSEWFIPGGTHINQHKARNFLSMTETRDTGGILFGPFERLSKFAGDDIPAIEKFLDMLLLGEIRRALSGYPFTAGVIIGFLFLKYRETRFLVSLYHAKRLNIKKEQITGET
jgi:V/A-type H+-transporting ATPase subunit C